MPTNLAQWERERFNYGDAAGDGKGDPIRVHTIKAEHTNNLVFSWLSGGASEVTLPAALPISRGGTGSTSVAGVIRTLGYFEDSNHVLRRGTKVLTLSNTGIADRFQTLPAASFIKTGLGQYSIYNVEQDTKLFGLVIPMNYFNQPKYFVETSLGVDGELVVSTYLIDTSILPYGPGLPVDLPLGVTIDIECK